MEHHKGDDFISPKGFSKDSFQFVAIKMMIQQCFSNFASASEGRR